MNEILAIAGVVIKELVRRKDFYVLFVLTGLITLVMGSVNLFHDDRIVRYLKEICLLLIWISSLVIAVTTTYPAARLAAATYVLDGLARLRISLDAGGACRVLLDPRPRPPRAGRPHPD